MNAFTFLQSAIDDYIEQTRPPGAHDAGKVDYAQRWGCLAPTLEQLAKDNKIIADLFMDKAAEFGGRAQEKATAQHQHGGLRKKKATQAYDIVASRRGGIQRLD